MMFDQLSPSIDYFGTIYENPRTLPNGLIEERVRVDRKLFERLIFWDELSIDPEAYAEGGPCMNAEEFFGTIMATTNTEIQWPCRLRLNSRSRRDPHIRIVGTPQAVQEARDQINGALDTRKNRVTLKMDVAFPDHSHVIGKGGRSIQKVMDDTGCHIHFPDSNRTNTFEKSNQVSIAGTTLGAAQARCRVRELLPLTIIYEVPMNELVRNAMESPIHLQALQRNFGISVSFRQPPRQPFFRQSFEMDPPLIPIAIRGSRAAVSTMRQGIALLLNQLTGGLLSFHNTAAVIETEIAAQHHSFVMGRGGVNIRGIMAKTKAVITFPDPLPTTATVFAPAASTVPNRRSTVTIHAPNFDSAFATWEELLGFLPLVLIFDLPDGHEIDGQQIQQMMDALNVSILIKPKQKQSNKSVTVRGAEKDNRLLFEVRRQLLNLDHSEVPFCCNKHYWNDTLSGLTLPATKEQSSTQPKTPDIFSVGNVSTSTLFTDTSLDSRVRGSLNYDLPDMTASTTAPAVLQLNEKGLKNISGHSSLFDSFGLFPPYKDIGPVPSTAPPIMSRVASFFSFDSGMTSNGSTPAPSAAPSERGSPRAFHESLNDKDIFALSGHIEPIGAEIKAMRESRRVR